jgi:anti-anti-sigma regulatory factor
MPTEIRQIDDIESARTTFRLAGEMLCEDAELLERIVKCVVDDSGNSVEIDLADVTLIDSNAASILRRLTDEEGYTIVGTEILLQNAVDVAERAN